MLDPKDVLMELQCKGEKIYTEKQVRSDALVIKETSVILQVPTRLKPYLWSACSVVLVIN